jgi:hypothetical protein
VGRLALIALLIAAGLPAVPAQAAQRNCGQIGFTPNTEDGVFEIRATRVSCKTARAVARRARDTGVTNGPRRYRARGFRCRGRFDDTTLPMVHWTCRRNSARVTFDRS